MGFPRRTFSGMGRRSIEIETRRHQPEKGFEVENFINTIQVSDAYLNQQTWPRFQILNHIPPLYLIVSRYIPIMTSDISI